MIIEVDNKNKHLSNAIIYYCYNLLSNEEREKIPLIIIREDDSFANYKINLGVNCNKIDINFNGNIITIEIIYEGDHISIGYTIDKYKKLIIKGDNLEDFINQANISFTDNVLLHYQDNKLNILTYDGVWVLSGYNDYRCIESISLPSKQLDPLLDDINKFLNNKDRYNSLNIPYHRNYLLYGPPGTGKTSLVKAVASKFKFNIATIEFSQDFKDYDLKRCLKKVPKNTIILIEDIDCLFQSRKNADEYKNSISFSGLLNSLDGIDINEGLMIFITTNHIDKLEVALKRRIGYFTQFDFSNKEQIKHIYNRFYPEQIDNFNEFYNGIKTQLTINILQKFFIKYLDDKNILDKVSYLNEFANNELKICDIKKEMYT